MTALLISGAIFIGFALLVVVAFVVQFRMAGRLSPDARVALVMIVVGVGAFLSVALLSRSLDDSLEGQVLYYADYENGFEASRYLSLLLIFWSLTEIIRGCIRVRLDPAPDPAMPVLWAMLAYYLGTLAIQAVASDHPEFSYRSLYVPILLAAICFQRISSLTMSITVVKWLILGLNLSSLAAALVAPDLVLHRPEPSVIPGINWRLFGFTTHANSLGPIALLAIILELFAPSQHRLMRWTHLAAALASLILSQSKTTWFAVPVLMLAVHAPAALFGKRASDSAGDRFARTVWTMLAYIAVLVVLTSVLAASDAIDAIERRANFATLNGRTQIWAITLEAWKHNILFGYGQGIWDIDRRTTFHMMYVGHAHNQIIQTLGEAGVVGLLLLLGYWGVLAWVAIREFGASRGSLLAILLLILVRSISEAPMRGEPILSWPNLMHTLLVLMSCHYLRKRVQTSPSMVEQASTERAEARRAGPWYRRAA